ncbi:MAG: glycosyltransferase family 87 protein [Polyangiales bacterium]
MGLARRGIGAIAATTIGVVFANGLATLQQAWLGVPVHGVVSVLVLPILIAGVVSWWKPSPLIAGPSAVAGGALLGALEWLPWAFLPLLFLVGLVVGAVTIRVAHELPPVVDGAWQRSRGKVIGWAVLGLFMLLQVSRLSVFMTDRDNTWGSTFPPIDFTVTHMCMGSYVEAADLTRQDAANIYSPDHYPSFGISSAEDIDTTVVGLQQYFDDAFLYPPPFLLLPRMWLGLSNDFLDIRSVWFAIQLLAFAAFAVFVARWVGGRAGTWALWLMPLLLASMPTMFNFQFGQAHLLTIWVTLAAMVAFESRRPVVGGALLAWGIASKIFPGVLLLYLLFQKRWSEVAWTALFGGFLVGITLLVTGTTPVIQFLTYMLPRLESGDAFSFVNDALPIVTNLSIPGTVWKLDYLGFEDGGALLGPLSLIYTVVLVAVVWFGSRLELDRAGRLQVWLALLIFASLRSPIVPIYGAVPILWLMTLEFDRVETAKGVALFAGSWIFINGLPPTPVPAITIALYGVAQLAVLYWVLRPLRRGHGMQPRT